MAVTETLYVDAGVSPLITFSAAAVDTAPIKVVPSD